MTAELIAIAALVAAAAGYAGWRLWRALTGRGGCRAADGDGDSPCAACSRKSCDEQGRVDNH